MAHKRASESEVVWGNLFEFFHDKPQMRLFRIGRESYVLFAGSSYEENYPFILVGNPWKGGHYLEHILIPDLLFANPFTLLPFYHNIETHHKGQVRLVGAQKGIDRFFSLTGLDLPYTVALRDKEKKKSRGVSVHTKKNDQFDPMVASFYDQGNIRVHVGRRVVFDLFQRRQKDLQPELEIKYLQRFFGKFFKGLLFQGFVNVGGESLFYDRESFVVGQLRTRHPLLHAALWGFEPKRLRAVYLPQDFQEGRAGLYNILRHNPSTTVLSSEPGIAKVVRLLSGDTTELIEGDGEVSFSAHYVLQAQVREKILRLNSGPTRNDYEFNFASADFAPDSQVFWVPKLPERVPRERQIWLVQSSFPEKFIHPYILPMPDNYRYEFRKLYSAGAVNDLWLELEVWRKSNPKLFPLGYWESFIGELQEVVDKLFNNAFQNLEIPLPKFNESISSGKWRSTKEGWKSLLQFNRRYIRWQLSGKKESFETMGILSKLHQGGFAHMGYVLLFQDGQAVTVFLPERNALVYLHGMSVPFLWHEKKLFQDEAYKQIKEKILAKDLIYFLQLFDDQVAHCPLDDLTMNAWRDAYAQWLQAYINEFALFLQEQERLNRLLAELEEHWAEIRAQNEQQDSQENSSRIFPFGRKASPSPGGKGEGFSSFFSKWPFSKWPFSKWPFSKWPFSKWPFSKSPFSMSPFSMSPFSMWPFSMWPFSRTSSGASAAPEEKSFGSGVTKSLSWFEGLVPGLRRWKVSLSGRRLQWGVLSLVVVGLVAATWFFYWYQSGQRVQKAVAHLPKHIQRVALNQGLRAKPLPQEIASEEWEALEQNLPYARRLRRYYRLKHNYGPDVLIFLNDMARINGYHSLGAPQNSNEQLKDPHWIYPGNELKKPDGSVWRVQKGENFWLIAKKELRHRADLFVRYLLWTDMGLWALAQDSSCNRIVDLLRLGPQQIQKKDVQELLAKKQPLCPGTAQFHWSRIASAWQSIEKEMPFRLENKAQVLNFWSYSLQKCRSFAFNKKQKTLIELREGILTRLKTRFAE